MKIVKTIAVSAALALSAMTMTGCAGLQTSTYQMADVHQQLGLIVAAKDTKVQSENTVLNSTIGTAVGAAVGSLFGGGNGQIVGTVAGGAIGAGAGMLASQIDGQELTIALDSQKGRIVKAAYPIKDGVKFKKNDYVIVTYDDKGKLLEITVEENRQAAAKKIGNVKSTQTSTAAPMILDTGYKASEGKVEKPAISDPKVFKKLEPTADHPDPWHYNPEVYEYGYNQKLKSYVYRYRSTGMIVDPNEVTRAISIDGGDGSWYYYDFADRKVYSYDDRSEVCYNPSESSATYNLGAIKCNSLPQFLQIPIAINQSKRFTDKELIQARDHRLGNKMEEQKSQSVFNKFFGDLKK